MRDPYVIGANEIRDLETAEIAIQAWLTGHLVFSTIHTNDAPGAISRLVEMGVEPFLVASALMGWLCGAAAGAGAVQGVPRTSGCPTDEELPPRCSSRAPS